MYRGLIPLENKRDNINLALRSYTNEVNIAEFVPLTEKQRLKYVIQDQYGSINEKERLLFLKNFNNKIPKRLEQYANLIFKDVAEEEEEINVNVLGLTSDDKGIKGVFNVARGKLQEVRKLITTDKVEIKIDNDFIKLQQQASKALFDAATKQPEILVKEESINEPKQEDEKKLETKIIKGINDKKTEFLKDSLDDEKNDDSSFELIEEYKNEIIDIFKTFNIKESDDINDKFSNLLDSNDINDFTKKLKEFTEDVKDERESSIEDKNDINKLLLNISQKFQDDGDFDVEDLEKMSKLIKEIVALNLAGDLQKKYIKELRKYMRKENKDIEGLNKTLNKIIDQQGKKKTTQEIESEEAPISTFSDTKDITIDNIPNIENISEINKKDALDKYKIAVEYYSILASMNEVMEKKEYQKFKKIRDINNDLMKDILNSEFLKDGKEISENGFLNDQQLKKFKKIKYKKESISIKNKTLDKINESVTLPKDEIPKVGPFNINTFEKKIEEIFKNR
jgi:hypothetical protein